MNFELVIDSIIRYEVGSTGYFMEDYNDKILYRFDGLDKITTTSLS